MDGGLGCAMPGFDGLMETSPSNFGELVAVRHAARFSEDPGALDPAVQSPNAPDWSGRSLDLRLGAVLSVQNVYDRLILLRRYQTTALL